MDKRKELKEEYKNRKTQAGIFKIVNPHGETLLVGSAADLAAMDNRMRFQLKWDTYLTEKLRDNCKRFGSEQLKFEIVETVKIEDKTKKEIEDLLEHALQKWQQSE